MDKIHVLQALPKAPGLVGNPAADPVCKRGHSTTPALNSGVLRGKTPKRRFAHFFAVEKVGRIRRCETSPSFWQGLPRKAGRVRGHEISPSR